MESTASSELGKTSVRGAKRPKSRDARSAKKGAKKPSKKAAKKKAVLARNAPKRNSAPRMRSAAIRRKVAAQEEAKTISESEPLAVRYAAIAPSLSALISSAGLPASFGVQDLLSRAREGVSIKVIDELRGWASSEVIAHAIAPSTTLSRWRKKDQPLTGSAADSTLRLVNIIAQAEQAFGDAQKARRWLAKSKSMLDPERPGISPLELAESEHGARLIEERLTQIAHGMFP